MNVTHVIPYMHPSAGGPPVVVDRLGQELVGRGWTIQVVTTDLMDDGTTTSWRDRLSSAYTLIVEKGSSPRDYFRRSSPLISAVEDAVRKCDLVHLHTLWTFPTFVAARVCRKIAKPYVVMPHGMLDPNSMERKWLKKRVYGALIEWPALRAARGMIYTHSEEQRLSESVVSGLPQGYVVPLGADDPPAVSRERLAEAFFQKHPAIRGLQIVLFLGRLHSKKGLDLLVPAISRVASVRPAAHFLLVGPGDDRYVGSLKQAVARLGIAEHVTFVGPLSGEAKWQAVAASDVFVLPSYQENFALTVVESMRMGLPIVLSRRVNIWEDVVSAGAGVACELTPESVADKLIEYLDNNAARQSAGQCGMRLVTQRFNWSASADAIESVYRRILGINDVGQTN